MPRVRLANGELRDQIRLDIFDTIIQAVGQSLEGTQKFFVDTANKEASQSNLSTSGLFENQVSYLVQGLGFDALTFNLENQKLLPQIMDASSLNFEVGEKSYWRGPLRFVAGRILADDPELLQFGTFAPSYYPLKGADSVAIPSVQRFRMLWQVETAAAAAVEEVRYIASLKGLQRRPVQ